MAYSIGSSQDGCYPGTTVLINKLGLRDQAALDQAERISVTLRAAELESNSCTEPFTFEFYCDLHRALFRDLYDWAGELRTIDLSKKGTAELLRLGQAKFRYLEDAAEFRGLEKNELAVRAADFYHELNMLHPFREGNGRTERLFFALLIRRCGYRISFAECDLDALLTATIYAAQGVQTYLTDFFREAIRENY